MKNLLRGIHHFQSGVFARERQLFEKLVSGQSPSTLFISCADSRIDPNLITQTSLGELFHLRNAGNMIPAYHAQASGEAATLEYAVSVLGVKDIIVCGHSNCGAINALLNPPQVEKLPLVRKWLELAESTRRIIEENYANYNGDSLAMVAVREHVLVQVENLQTHPCVASRMQRGDLRLHAWTYLLESGEIWAYSSSDEQFLPLKAEDDAGRVVQSPRKRKPGGLRP